MQHEPDDSADVEYLRAAHAAAAQAWPCIALSEAAFLPYLAARARGHGAIADALASLRVDDLFLACACAHHVPEALAVFERNYLCRVPLFVARIDRSPAFTDEITQLVRLKLLVDDDQTPCRIATYGGQGSLDSWLCAVAVRTALSVIRARSDDHAGDAALDEALGGDGDVELDHLRRHYGPVFRDTVREAIAALDAPARNLLRFHFVDNLPLHQIGALRGVHASTVMRRLRDLRAALQRDVRSRLRARLGLAADELDSLERIVADGLDLSLSEAFGDRSQPA